MDKLGTGHGIKASNKEVGKEVCRAEMVALTRQMIAFRDALLSMQSEIPSLRNRESSSSESRPEQNDFSVVRPAPVHAGTYVSPADIRRFLRLVLLHRLFHQSENNKSS